MTKKRKNKKESKKKGKKNSKNADRCPTGIKGFDGLVQGGLPDNSSILVCGGPGTGKSIFSLQYIVNGAEKFDEKGLYVTFEQPAQALRDQAAQFGWNLEKLEEEGKVKIMSISIDDLTKNTINEIREIVEKENFKRIVIDSLSTLVINAPIYTTPSELSAEDVMEDNVVFSPPVIGDYIVKRFIYNFIEKLRDLDCTSLLISEANQSEDYISRDTLSEFVCDGVIMISFEALGGEFSRSLIVRKMRQTNNNDDVRPMEICDEGVIIHETV